MSKRRALVEGTTLSNGILYNKMAVTDAMVLCGKSQLLERERIFAPHYVIMMAICTQIF
jgi:hypothetical protein